MDKRTDGGPLYPQTDILRISTTAPLDCGNEDNTHTYWEQPGISRLDALADALFVVYVAEQEMLNDEHMGQLSRNCHKAARMHIAVGEQLDKESEGEVTPDETS